MKIRLLIIVLFLLSACKRDETRVNEGCTDDCTIFNVKASTGNQSLTPVKGAFVELSWLNKATSYPFGDSGRLIATGITDENGLLTFSFKALDKELKGGNYSIIIQNNQDGFQPYVNYKISKADTIVKANIHIPSKATIKIVYRNFDPKAPEDILSANPYYKNFGMENLNIKSLTNLGGGLGNTYFYAKDGAFSKVELVGTTAGNQYTYFSILRKKNGIRQDLIDSIYVPINETRTYEIIY